MAPLNGGRVGFAKAAREATSGDFMLE